MGEEEEEEGMDSLGSLGGSGGRDLVAHHILETPNEENLQMLMTRMEFDVRRAKLNL